MIDGMIDEEAAAVRALWSKQGGAGLYPPKSLHALLTIYLLENISQASKHSLVAYFFLDLISMMGEKDQNLVDRLSRFCQAIHLPQSRTRMIQGFWLLDHKDFEEAVLLLLDPMLLEEMLPWQHNRIIKAFLYQGEEKIALKFLRVKKPPLVTPEDIRLHLTVLLANGLISEAFEYQKVCSNNERDNDNLLGHLFTACQQTKTIDRLLQLPLTDGEERQLLQYLRDSKETRNMEILMLHFLQRARYVEAIRLNEKLGQTLLHESDPKTRERAAARNSIVECYSKVLPSVQRKLTFGSDHRPKKTMHLTRREIQRPRPLSTVVHHNNNQKVISNAMLINAVLEKIGETRPLPEQTPVRNRPQPSDTALGPFICTPVTPRAKSNLISEDTEIVYPSIQRDARTEERSRTVSPVKKMVTGLMPQTSLASPVTAKNQNVNRILSTEALSLLQTPPVKRRTPPTLKKLTSLQHTPQSILKVRQVVKRSPSPSPLQQDQPQTIKRLSFLNADLALETPPRYQRKKVEVRKTKVKDTPKHLRFAGLSTPSPEPSPPKAPSPRRTRRRSPTPERTPPEQVTVSSRRPLRNDTDEEQTPTGSQKKTSVDIADDDIQVVDAEVTFNFDKSKQEEAIADEEAMETSEGDGSSIVTSTTSAGLGHQRVSFQLENNYEEQVLVSGDRDSPPTVDLTTTETESGEASLAPSSSEPLPNLEEEKMDIDENAESSVPSEYDKNMSEKIKLQAGSVLREDETVTLAPLVVIPPDSVTSLEQPSPVRRSPRFAHSEISEQTSEFKTPPRPSHLSPRPISLPALPTPPESVRGSPTRSPSRLLRQRSASRSPSKSPPRHAPEMESTIAAEQVKGRKSPSRTRKSPSRSRTPERKAPSPTRTRGSSESPSGSPLSQEARAASPSRTIQSKGRKSPSRGTKSPSRSKSPVKDKDQAAENVEDVGEKSPTRRTRKSPARSKSPEKLSISPRRTRGSTPSRSDSPEKDQISRRTRGSTPTRTELPEEQQASRRTRGSTPSRTESPERVPQSPGRGRNQRQSNKSTESKTSPSRPRSPEVKPKSPGRGRKTPAKSVAAKEKDRTPSPSKSPQGAPLGSRLRTRKVTESSVPTEGSTETLSDKDKSPDSHAPVTRAKSPARLRKTPAENLKKSVIIEVDNLTSEGSPEVVLKSPSRQRKSGGRGKKTSSAKEPSTSEKSSEETETETEKETVPPAKSPSRKGRKSPSRSPAAPQTTEVPQEEVKNAATVPKSVPRRATRATRASSVDSEVTDTDVPAQPSEVEETPVTSRAKSVKKIGAKTKSTGRSPARTRKAKKSEEKEQLQFTFSEPTVIPHDLESLDMPGLPFVFSPPVTRTRSHKMEPLEEEEVIEGSPLGGAKIKAKKEPKKAAAKKSTKTRKTTVSSPSDSPVSLLSPSTEEHQETSVPTRTRVRRMASQSQSLRPKTSPPKKRKTVKK
ncbi:protein ELYS isoform X4 [Lingula anatina]|uniref:Protein ELYS isoform X4 n=1 Tax=Lingula anatina TaxID=7574 RepID=A0A1S3J6X5_LINAN|nr:protein ELYS isoform X4 [Lingula anatina]|eukprot:XP_013406167.1 protein ELYS isoform X4 [Lingula anatina]